MASMEPPKTYKVLVHVTGCPTPFRVACGSGMQTVRWLSGVVSQRYAARPKSGGRRRHRETLRCKRGRFLPMAITTMAGDVLHPSSRLRDVLPFSENELCMSLQQAVVLDNVGSVRRTAWASDAFVISDVGRQRVRRIREELAEREAIAKADEEVKMEVAVSRAHHDSVNKLLAVDLDSKEAVQTAMEADWPDIRVHRFTKEAKEQEKLKLLILKSFVLISDLYKHYSGTLPSGNITSMCKVEFLHFVRNTGALTLPRDEAVLPKILRAANASRSTDQGNTANVITRFEFIEALIACAIHKMSADRGNRAVRPTAALQKLIEENLEPAAKRLSMGAVRTAMHTREMEMAMRKALPILRRVFDRYRDKDTTSASSHAMNIAEFAMFLQDASLLGPRPKEEGGDDIPLQRARQIFAGCQLSEDASSAGAGTVFQRDPPDEMVLSEFLEAVVRLAAERYASLTDLSVARKFQRLVKELHIAVDPAFAGLPHEALPQPQAAPPELGGRFRHRRRSVDLFQGTLVRPTSSPGGAAAVESPPVAAALQHPARSPGPLAVRPVTAGSMGHGGMAGALPSTTPHATGASLPGRYSVPATPNAANFAWD